MSLEPKKLALLRILEIYQKYSDENHLLTQEEIADHLSRDYGIDLERKAIGRNISLLCEAGYDVVYTKYGSYLSERPFDDAELRLLIDGVLTSKHISASHSRALIEKLCGLSNCYFRSHVKNVCSVGEWSKTENGTLFYNITVVDEAIERGRQIRFDYNKFGIDKKLHRSSVNTVSAYQLFLHNQRYYLMAFHEKWKEITFYRMDRITEISILDEPSTLLRSIPGYESGIDYHKISEALPYMYSDRVETVTFLAKPEIIDQVVDWFGYDADLREQENGVLVTVRVSQKAMEYWALQYLNYIEVLSPASLREQLRKDIFCASEKYRENR